MTLFNKRMLLLGAVLMALFLISEPSFAAGAGDLPWDKPLEKIGKSIQGPVAKILGAIAIFVFGMGVAFSESGGMQKKALSIIFGLSIAFSATSFGLSFFGFGGGVAL